MDAKTKNALLALLESNPALAKGMLAKAEKMANAEKAKAAQEKALAAIGGQIEVAILADDDVLASVKDAKKALKVALVIQYAVKPDADGNIPEDGTPEFFVTAIKVTKKGGVRTGTASSTKGITVTDADVKAADALRNKASQEDAAKTADMKHGTLKDRARRAGGMAAFRKLTKDDIGAAVGGDDT